ncbi:MAG: hypothetical protein ACR2NG_08890 [Acidimicrobiia bacterium]
MRRILILTAVAALAFGACASDGGTSDDEASESLPVNELPSSASEETPIPVEPNEGIGDGAEPLEQPVVSPELADEVELALQDLEGRVDQDRVIRVVVAHELTWPDGSLGCPQPDSAYTQALVDGYRIEFADGTYRFVYHGAVGSEPFLCVEGEEGSPALAEVPAPPIELTPGDTSKEGEPTEQLGGPGGTPDD